MDYKNIACITFSDLSSSGSSVIYNDSFIVQQIFSKTSIILKYYLDDQKSWENNIYSFGPIINLDKFHYMELTYGYGIDSHDKRADYYMIDIVREKAKYLLGLGLKHSNYLDKYSNNQISPYLKYHLNVHLSLWWKLFYDIDSLDKSGISNWIEAEFIIRDKLKQKLGYSFGDGFSYEDGNHYEVKSNSIISGLKYQIKENIELSYTLTIDKKAYKNYNDDGNTHTFCIGINF